MGLIDNQDSNTLVVALRSALRTAKAIDIFTGYFFFSGFHEIAEEIKDINVRIIVGMDIDPTIVVNKRITDDSDLSRYRLADPPSTNTAKVNNYRDSFIALFNNTDVFDKERTSGTLEVFFEKIKNGSLEIKMALGLQHAKYYLVHNKDEFMQDGANPGTRFMGSSNFTVSGLKGQGELNERKIDPDDFRSYLDRFNLAWQSAESVSVLDQYKTDDFLAKIKDETSLYQKPSPHLVYARILKELFDRPRQSGVKYPRELSGNLYKDFEYQTDAVIDALDIIEKYNGVIVADVVGLGKSVIASAVAANLDNKTFIITPPHLKPQWENYASEFDLNHQIYTSGQIEKALASSHHGKTKTIIIDEAHRYRNEDTDSYQLLHKLCLNNKVMLLTATPFNNDPKDLFALIRLFDAPSQSRINTVDNLSIEFRGLITEYQRMRRNLKKMDELDIKEKAKEIAQKMRAMAYPVIIRRSRIDLEQVDRYRTDLSSQNYELPKIGDPILLEYNLDELASLYQSTLEKITDANEGFTAARYQPSSFVNNVEQFKDYMKQYYDSIDELKHAQTNLSSVMRRLLVMRFESSIAAFKKTLDNFINGHNIIIQWYEKFQCVPVYKKGNIPDPSLIEEAFDTDEVSKEFGEDILERALTHKKLEKDVARGMILIPASMLSKGFMLALEHDVKLLKEVKQEWQQKTRVVHLDPKFDHIQARVKQLLDQVRERKIVIFTSYTDTADYLDKKLKDQNIRTFKYTGTIASAYNQKIVKDNFDAGLPDSQQKDDFDVLVATDAISEGYNLHRAGVIINYDIPYNPVRVIQRVGRINRINKKLFDQLFIFNCFPTLIGENEVSTKRISGLKIHLMNALMGNDAKILTHDEEIQTFFVDKFKEADEQNNEESWDTEYINYWDTIKYDKKLMDSIQQIKQRTFLAREGPTEGIVLFGKRGKGLPIFVTNINHNESSRVSADKVLHLLKAEPNEKALNPSKNFEGLFRDASNKLFKSDKLPKNQGRRRNALKTLEILEELHPKARDHCIDAKKIIKDLDGFPEGSLKKIVNLEKQYFKQEDFRGAYEELQKIAPVDYMNDLHKRVQGRLNEPETLLIAEELE